ncbi:hypothetical protein Z967_08230 [Clostridium novyi A str. 4540]|uniref:hypothetical protein n=1 Tax=Clostridium novyi TaxID=1542 RepID=UPI0004DA2237|nr:hypothetical protein [Clostridium novyi]KEH89564.1 hypothetical protein Z967_08230 [Clostridium novyi A str. 4540]
MENIYNCETYKEIKSGVVTFLDVLGWKGIYHRDNNAIQKLINISKQGKTVIKSIIDKYKSITIEMFLISDTIIIISYNNNFKEGKDLKKGVQFSAHAKIVTNLIERGLKQNILFRGATAYGSYSFSKNDLVFMGEAIDEAAEWHEFSNWCGVIATPSAQIIIESLINNNKNKTKLFYEVLKSKWVEYENIPLKSKDIKLKYALNWIDKISISKIRSILATNGPYNINIASKYLNTLEFVTFITYMKTNNEKYVSADCTKL